MNRSGTIRARRALGAMTAATLALLLLLGPGVPAAAEPGNDNRAPELPGDAAKLAVGAGHKVSSHAYATGVQIYRWDGSAWTFVGPEAILLADDEDGNGVIGIHYAGPTWESNSGSTVVGAVVDRATVDADAIPWLKLKAASTSGPGIYKNVTFIQRVNTVGGLAPATPGTAVGEEARVPYTAEYYFYRKHGR